MIAAPVPAPVGVGAGAAVVPGPHAKGATMVIEYLTFEIEPADLASWLEVEERTWSRFLERQPGFVRKQMWVERGETRLVHAVIWWADQASWNACAGPALAAVDEAMGPWFRDAISCRVFEVVRDC